MFEQVKINSERWLKPKLLLNEIFKDIKGYEGIYKISNYGRIKNNKNIIRKYDISNKYYSIILFKNNKQKHYLIHRLIAQAFIPNPNNYPQINHIDGNKLNNKIDNLEWCSISHNIKEAFRLGLNKSKPHNLDNRKKVGIYDKNDVLIKMWSSITEASNETKINRNTISKYCTKNKQLKGKNYWQFIDNN